mgnify:CR=1 FL=1
MSSKQDIYIYIYFQLGITIHAYKYFPKQAKQDFIKALKHSFIKDTTHLVLQTSGSKQVQTLQTHGKVYWMHFQASSTCMQMISAFPKTKANQNKHNSLSRKTCWATTRARPRSHTSLPRCCLDGHIQRNEVGKNLGFPFSKNMNMRKMNSKIVICYFKIWDFMLWVQKHGPGYLYSRILWEQTQKHES